jgi:hypothetical protein
MAGPNPSSLCSLGRDHPKRAANALTWTADRGVWKAVTYLSRCSEVMRASSRTTPRDFIKIFLLLEHTRGCCNCCSAPRPAILWLLRVASGGGLCSAA